MITIAFTHNWLFTMCRVCFCHRWIARANRKWNYASFYQLQAQKKTFQTVLNWLRARRREKQLIWFNFCLSFVILLSHSDANNHEQLLLSVIKSFNLHRFTFSEFTATPHKRNVSSEMINWQTMQFCLSPLTTLDPSRWWSYVISWWQLATTDKINDYCVNCHPWWVYWFIS